MSAPSRALIGYTGFVGTTLRDQVEEGYFTHLYNSKNINDITGEGAPPEFDVVVCAGISAVKWYANKNPDEDIQRIESLMASIRGVKVKKFILISTIDVYFPHDGQLDENSPLEPGQTHAYGSHRLMFEKFVEKTWADHYLIVRLPGLFGPHLRKNVLYDLVHSHMLANIRQAMLIQWYPMTRLWSDIQLAVTAKDGNITSINLFPQAVGVDEIVSKFFPQFADQVQPMPAEGNKYTFVYDTCSIHASIFTGNDSDKYMMGKDDVLKELEAFFASAKETTEPPGQD